ncbi:CaiB/BaiF CoA transferase family protein [Leifsonia sp. AG29]|uniref:CaiB/BaiF CoA transferase family protein n=1 Tax=Leifsonia sp. AG29 TaxID=2598860 RepID=UPI00131B888C|nr:CaiB/BaiF CoA-transferase family protein [Leifsonia sp. AG29]
MTLPVESTGALAGLRVLDATQMLAGPLAATRLGDLGADVIKVESPGTGEFNRTHGFGDQLVDGEMSTFVAVNRNKRSLAINLKDERARSAFDELVRGADVLIQNFRRGTATRLGLDYERLSSLNPGLVYCSISGYGSEGPYADRPGQDLVLQGYSGSMFSVGAEDDAPVPGALWAADVMTGYQAAIGILAALHARSVTGRGQHVEVDMYSVVLDAQLQELVTFLNTGFRPQRSAESSAHAAIPAPYGVYRTSDGWLTLAMSPLPALGEMLDDDWLRTLTAYNDGHERRDEVFAHIRHLFEGRTTSEWVALADEHGVWAGPVYDYEDLPGDVHLRETGAFVHQSGSWTGAPVVTLRPPIKLSESAVGIRRGAPRLGADSLDVLKEAGVDPATIDALIATGAVTTTERLPLSQTV